MISLHRHDNHNRNEFSKRKFYFPVEKHFHFTLCDGILRTSLLLTSRLSLKSIFNDFTNMFLFTIVRWTKKTRKNCVIKFLLLLVFVSMRKGENQEKLKFVDNCRDELWHHFTTSDKMMLTSFWLDPKITLHKHLRAQRHFKSSTKQRRLIKLIFDCKDRRMVNLRCNCVACFVNASHLNSTLTLTQSEARKTFSIKKIFLFLFYYLNFFWLHIFSLFGWCIRFEWWEISKHI